MERDTTLIGRHTWHWKDCFQTKLGSAHLMQIRAKLLTQDCDEGKYNVCCKPPLVGPSNEKRHHMLRRPRLPMGEGF